MKKIALSVSVIAVFIIYSLQQRHETSATVVAPTPVAQTDQTTQSTTTPTPTTTAAPTTQTAAAYKDGVYTGNAADAFYGNIQVRATITDGKIAKVEFLQYPNDRDNSVEINQQAMPYLRQEAIQAQSAQVHVISGATDTSIAFTQSLSSALAKAT